MNFRAKKRFGQNFLINPYIINEIVAIINPQKNDTIIEIGPGFGALTKSLIEYSNHVEIIEIDRDIVKTLEETFANKPVTIHSADALRFNFTFNNKPIRIVGNLPYNISTQLLFHLAQFDNIKDMHFMLQEEVANRICAKPNSHAYGRLSIMMQYKFNCSKMLDVDKNNFDPVPKVQSAIIKLSPKEKSLWENVNVKILNKVVTCAFNHRRKTLNNSLKSLISNDILKQLGIDANKRAENITIEEYLELSEQVEIKVKDGKEK